MQHYHPNAEGLRRSSLPMKRSATADDSTHSIASDIENNDHKSTSISDLRNQKHSSRSPHDREATSPPASFLSTSMSRGRELAFICLICTVQLIPQATLTVCFPSGQAIAVFFKLTNHTLLPWINAAYALTFGTFILIAGRLGDIFGHKRMVILGFCILACSSLMAGLSHYTTYEVFFVARALQGLGSAMMNPNGIALLGRTYAPDSKQKIMAFSLFGLCAPGGAYLGMILGAVFTEFVEWYWAFYVLAVISIMLACLAQIVFLSPPKTPKQMLPFRRKCGVMDWLGAFTGVTALICFEVAWVCAPGTGWRTQYIYMLVIIGTILGAVFLLVETSIAQQPLVPFKILQSDVGFVLSAVACGWATFGIWSWYLWRILLDIWQDKPLQACLHVVPIIPVALIASAVTALLMQKTKPSWILLGSLTSFALGSLFLSFMQTNQIYWSFCFVSLLVTPWGMDMSLPSAMMVVSNTLPNDKQGVAGSLVSTVVNYSISLGLGFAATAQTYVPNPQSDPLVGIRAACFVGTGLGALGALISAVFLLRQFFYERKQQHQKPASDCSPEAHSQSKPRSQTTLAPSPVLDSFVTFPPFEQPAQWELPPDKPVHRSVSSSTISDRSYPPRTSSKRVPQGKALGAPFESPSRGACNGSIQSLMFPTETCQSRLPVTVNGVPIGQAFG